MRYSDVRKHSFKILPVDPMVGYSYEELLGSFSVREMRRILDKIGLTVRGDKSELAQRLLKFGQNEVNNWVSILQACTGESRLNGNRCMAKKRSDPDYRRKEADADAAKRVEKRSVSSRGGDAHATKRVEKRSVSSSQGGR